MQRLDLAKNETARLADARNTRLDCVDGVAWITIDGDYARRSDTFADVFGRTIEQMRSLALKPMLVSVTSAAPAADQFDKITDMFSGLRRYEVGGLIWAVQDQRRRDRPVGPAGESAAAAR